MTIVRPLQGPSARYLPTTGMMLVSQSAAHLMEQLTPPVTSAHQTAVRFAFFHETLHHLQVLSSSYLWSDMIERLELVPDLLWPTSPRIRRAAAMRWRRQDKAFGHRVCGVSVRDLCEGSAVLESYQALATGRDPEGFLAWRAVEFPGKGNSPYRRTFDIVADELGPEAAFDLLPVLTFLALHSDVPGQAFEQFLRRPALRGFAGASLREIAAGLGVSVPHLPAVLAGDRHRQSPALYPVLLHSYAAITGDPEEEFARPHRLLRGSVINDFAPPIVMGAYRLPPAPGERVPMLTFGAAEGDMNLQLIIMTQTALVEAARRLATGDAGRVVCPLTACPNHASGMCAGWYFPLADVAEQCVFRHHFRDATGRELHEAADLVLPAATGPEDLGELFRGPADLLDGPSSADRFDDRYLLDPEDNDQIVVLQCAHCRDMSVRRASERAIALGFDYLCETCGQPGRFDSTGVPRFTL